MRTTQKIYMVLHPSIPTDCATINTRLVRSFGEGYQPNYIYTLVGKLKKEGRIRRVKQGFYVRAKPVPNPFKP